MAEAKIDLSPEEVARILAERAALREKQKELTKTLQKAKLPKDDDRHTLAVKIPMTWFEALKEYAEGQGVKVARLHFGALKTFLESKGFDTSEETDEE